MSDIRNRALRIASALPVGDPFRRNLLSVLRQGAVPGLQTLRVVDHTQGGSYSFEVEVVSTLPVPKSISTWFKGTWHRHDYRGRLRDPPQPNHVKDSDGLTFGSVDAFLKKYKAGISLQGWRNREGWQHLYPDRNYSY